MVSPKLSDRYADLFPVYITSRTPFVLEKSNPVH